MFRYESGRNVNGFSASMSTEYAKTKAKKFLRNFVFFSQLAVRSEMICKISILSPFAF